MKQSTLTIYSLFTLLLLSAPTYSATLFFEYTARVNSSDRPGAPAGSLLTGIFSYDPDTVTQVAAGNYFPNSNTATLSARGESGFFLRRNARVIVVTPGGTNDSVTLQSFVSEDPNGWNMVFDFIEPATNGWLQGDSSLPNDFPASPANGFISLYFTDEGDWIRSVDASILSVSVTTVPLPAAVWLFASSLGALFMARRKIYPAR